MIYKFPFLNWMTEVSELFNYILVLQTDVKMLRAITQDGTWAQAIVREETKPYEIPPADLSYWWLVEICFY